MPVKRTIKKQARLKSNAKEPPSIDAEVQTVIQSLKRRASNKVRDEMSTRYGIRLPDPNKAFGVKMADMQKIAKSARSKDAVRNHELALALWNTGWYEARMVACMVDDAELVTPAQMDRWCEDFDNWAIVDTVCFKLFDQSPHAPARVAKWAKAKNEFQKRAAFALLACLALHNKEMDDDFFAESLPLIERAATDDRNFVKKGVSWALRAYGLRGPRLKSAALALAQKLSESDVSSSRWIGRDALRDLSKRR